MKLQLPILNPDAFPRSSGALGDGGYDGMSLRDYFAGHALLVAALTATKEAETVPAPNEIAAQAFEIADAMLRERSEDITCVEKAEARFDAMQRFFGDIPTAAIETLADDSIESARKFVLRLTHDTGDPS